jgi:uncharacterized RDD family membrane protein YckC
MRYKKLEESFLGVEPTLATIPARFIAMMIDLGIITLIFYFIFILLKWLNFKIEHIELMNFHHIEMKSDEISQKSIQFLKIFFGFIPTIYFTLIMYFTNGQTIGKRILGIRIVSLYHHRISFWHCLERSLGYIASTLEIGLGFLQVFWNPNRMTLHDRIAETIVVRMLKKK